jgi:hypothetical protein
MSIRKTALTKLVMMALTAVMAATTGAAQATIVSGGTLTPLITAGAPPDSPAAHVDPNTVDSRFSGVVSINIRYGGQSFICSGSLVGARQVVSAGHCVDTDGNGTLIDLTQPGNDVRVVFNNQQPGGAIYTAVGVSMHQDYEGFGNCPAGVAGFCVNDDIAMITLGADAPATATIYKIASSPLLAGTHIIMAGYGRSGDGINGYTTGPDFRIKRSGENYTDLFDGDDENGWGGANEVWYADFDGLGIDTFCDLFGACSPILANNRESGIGGGDSGGPSFVDKDGELFLVGNNTFGGTFTGFKEGAFGTYFGGMVLSGYTDYLTSSSGGNIQFANLVPEPAGIALFGLGALGLLGARRRSIRN